MTSKPYRLSESQAHALLLQRTGYQPNWSTWLRRLRLGGLYDAKIASKTSEGERDRIGALYRDECVAEAEHLLPLFPDGASAIMDIGCGLAGPDLEVARRMPDAHFTLVDKDEFNDTPTYGFKSEASAYNSLEETLTFLRVNGLDGSRVATVNVLDENLPTARKFDAVISLISWGFHYPVDAYVTEVKQALRPGGVAILDIRGGTDGVAKLEASFGQGNVTAVPTPHSDITRFMATR